MFQKMYHKGEKLAKIARKLAQESKFSRNGKPFSGQQLKRMILGYEETYKKVKTQEVEMTKLMKELLLTS